MNHKDTEDTEKSVLSYPEAKPLRSEIGVMKRGLKFIRPLLLLALCRVVPTIVLYIIAQTSAQLFLMENNPWMWSAVWAADKIPSDPHYECPISVSESVKIQIVYNIYAGRWPNGRQIDPNNYQDEPLPSDLFPHMLLEIPYMDYEISHDNGESWEIVWRFQNQWSDSDERCNFDSLDDTHFWVWNTYGLAVTHDGGHTWFVHSLPYLESGYRNVEFTSENEGRIERGSGRDLLTTDGGWTWYE